jgi:hypothetical protein
MEPYIVTLNMLFSEELTKLLRLEHSVGLGLANWAANIEWICFVSQDSISSCLGALLDIPLSLCFDSAESPPHQTGMTSQLIFLLQLSYRSLLP